MSQLEELRRQRSALDSQIAKLEKADAEAKKAATIEKHYLKVACDYCLGTGEMGEDCGSDNTDIMTVDCSSCKGRGFLLARKWLGRARHDMDYCEVVSAL